MNCIGMKITNGSEDGAAEEDWAQESPLTLFIGFAW